MKAIYTVIGSKFGNFEVISEPTIINGYRKVQVKCVCGIIKTQLCCNLKRLKQCKKCTGLSYRKFKIGDKIHNLLIIDYYTENKTQISYYIVQCKCGSVPYKIKSCELSKTKQCKKCYSTGIGYNHKSYSGTKNISKTYFSQVKLGAKKRNLEFNITIENMQLMYDNQNGLCKFSKLPIIIGNEKIETTASLDRIDSTKGYTVDNVQWVHKDINRMKTDFNQEYFYKLCQLVTENKN